jgi:hypothetical protein
MLQQFIEQLLKSRVQTNLVTFFVANPDRAFYLGELEKRIGGKDLQKELHNLQKMGFLTSYSRKGSKYFRAQKKHPHYRDLQLLVQKSVRTYEDELVKAVRGLKGVKAAVLSGLFVSDSKAPCDILIIGEPTEKALETFIFGVERLMGNEVNYTVFNPKEFEYRKHIFDRFTKDLLEHEHILIENKKR